jgi:hypothetical protein
VRRQFSGNSNNEHGRLQWLSFLVELVEEPLQQPVIPHQQVDDVKGGTQHTDLKS